MHPVRHTKWLTQGALGAMEIVIKDLQADQRIPSGISFRKGMGLASQGIESITQGSIEPFHMHGSSRKEAASHCGTNLDRQEASMLIMMLNRLRQGHRVGDDQLAPSPSAITRLRLAIGVLQDARIVLPTITEPAKRTLLGSSNRRRNCLCDQVLTEGTSCGSDHEATVAILDQTTPAFSLVRPFCCALFFCTNDQNSSISTWLRCRSQASTCVRASACSAARLSHTPMVSYLCPVISSAARKLPRRITTSNACATSWAGVFKPYIGVPCVSPKYVLHVRHRYLCRPRWLPLRTTRDCEHSALGHVGTLLCSGFSLWFIFHLLPSILSPLSRVTTKECQTGQNTHRANSSRIQSIFNAPLRIYTSYDKSEVCCCA